MMGHLEPVGPGRVKPPACRQAGRGGRKGKGGHPPPLDKGGSDAWRACAADGAAAAGVVWDASETRAWAPGPDQRASDGVRPSAPYIFYIYARCHCGGPRNGAGIRQCHLETDGNNDMHWHLRAEEYHIVISVPTPMPNVTIFRYVAGADALGLLPMPDARGVGPGTCRTRPAPVTVPGALAFGMDRGIGTEVHDKGPPWVVSPIPLQGALAMGCPGRHQRD